MNAVWMRFSARQFKEIDWLLLGCVLLLTAFGIVVIDGAKFPAEQHLRAVENLPAPWISRHALKMLAFWALSLAAGALALLIPYHALERAAFPFYLFCLALLVYLLVQRETIKGAASWIALPGSGLRLQPAELTKIAVVLMLAAELARLERGIRGIRDLLKPALWLGLPFVLIVLQNDLGTAMVLPAVGLAMIWLAGVPKRYLLAGTLLAALTGALVYPKLKPHHKQRIETFLNPRSDPLGGGYNIRQAEIALGSGQLFGKGWRQGTQSRLQFLPEAHTDFIFSSLGEQFGLAGALALLTLYLTIFRRAFAIADNARDPLGAYLAIGLIAIVVTHALYNIGMALRFLPVTGLPLPLISYGGSFLLTNYILFGLILNVGMRKYFFD